MNSAEVSIVKKEEAPSAFSRGWELINVSSGGNSLALNFFASNIMFKHFNYYWKGSMSHVITLK